ncbi:phosphoadenosine phosphosulfate reductase family protein (plasmid) [Rossellomorea sp. AcN35-11]|nr:phosphoadenosine phosphosulfate reductase family protein [Rossellomorea aquimaris]WJV32384.1 phosphoadenosine phosphosulfate reductase family protein [Rossellomorea sp. AcN35-11]
MSKEQKRIEQAASDTRWFTNPEREMRRFQILIERMKRVYLQDTNDWIVAFSSGKDSSLTLDLTFKMLENLKPEQRNKSIHVVSADTQVETPQMVSFLRKNLNLIKKKGKGLGIKVHYVVPEMKENYWWNIIGRGNPAPTPKSPFSWCSKKLKLQPMSRKLKEINRLQEVGMFGENIPYDTTLLLGVRNAESAKRKRSIKKHSLDNYFARHHDIDSIRVFHPVKFIKDADLWNYIHYNQELAWGLPSMELWKMYSEGQEECAIVRTEKDKSCGASSSRSGCWTCLYSPREDPMLEILIKAGNENINYLSDWKKFLFDVKFDVRYREPLRRDIYKERLKGKVIDLFSASDFYYNHYQRAEKGEEGAYKPGSYTFELRVMLLEKLLYAQEKSGYLLITDEEYKAVLQCWREDGYDVDSLNIQPRNHQHDGAVVLKPDWRLVTSGSDNPRPNPNPVFYVPVEFQFEGRELVSFVQERQRLTGKSIFCYFDYEEHENIRLVNNKLVFIVCEKDIQSQEEAKQKVMNYLFIEGTKESTGTDGEPYQSMQGKSFDAALQHILLDSLKPTINRLSNKEEELSKFNEKDTKTVVFMHQILGNIKKEKQAQEDTKKIHTISPSQRVPKQMCLF